MDNINKIISFVLGLIVVVVFIAIVTGRFNLGKKVKTLTKSSTTPTATPKLSPKNTPKVTVTYPSGTATPGSTGYRSTTSPTLGAQNTQPTTQNGYRSTSPTGGQLSYANQNTNSNVSTIPNTGAPTLLLPTAISMLIGGFLLKRLSKKN